MKNDEDDEIRDEYDFSEGIQGEHYEEVIRSSNIVVIDPELSSLFPNSAAVNEGLRLLLRLIRTDRDAIEKAQFSLEQNAA